MMTMAAITATSATLPITIPAMAPAAAAPHRLPSWGDEVQPEGGGTGSAGAWARGAAPKVESCGIRKGGKWLMTVSGSDGEAGELYDSRTMREGEREAK